MAQKLTLLGRLLPQTSWSLFSATRRLIWQFQWIQLSVTTRLIWQFCWVNSFILPEILMELVCKDHLHAKYNAPHQISIWSIKSLISKEIKAKQCGQNELLTTWNTENNFRYFLKIVETITTERVGLPLLLTSSRQVLAAHHRRMFLHALLQLKKNYSKKSYNYLYRPYINSARGQRPRLVGIARPILNQL